MSRKDWRTVSTGDVDFDAAGLANQLTATLRAKAAEVQLKSVDFGLRLAEECREGLSAVLPFTDCEREFLDLLMDEGVVDSSILTDDDEALQPRIQSQPLLEWKALNVRRHKGLS